MNLPKDYQNFLLQYWKAGDVDTLLQGLDGDTSVSIRLNTNRLSAAIVPEGADGQVPWCPEGYYLRERPTFTADPLFHAGAYYVQEASSMFLAHVLRHLNSPLSTLNFQLSTFRSAQRDAPHLENFQLHTVLDLCAAPGGKSTLMRSILPDDCLLISNEPNRQRAQVLAENMAKWGHPNVLVTQAYATEIAHSIEPVDLILADVPCSGEGMFRKEEEAVCQWSPRLVADCAALQRSIVADIWPLLRPGGILIYSTCTFNPEEDENNVEWIARELDAVPLAIPIESNWGIRGDLRRGHTADAALPCYHFLPGQVRGEGFFLAVLQKQGTHQKHIKTTKNAHFIEEQPESDRGRKTHQKHIKNAKNAHSIVALPTNQLDEPGVPYVELSLADAIRYLQRESLILPPDAPRGHVQVCYHGQRLGLMNNLGSRANNLYPKEWRIRSGHHTPHTLFALTAPKGE